MVASLAQYQAVLKKARQAVAEVQPAANQASAAVQKKFCSSTADGVAGGIVSGITGGLALNPLCPAAKLSIKEFEIYLAEFLVQVTQALDLLEDVPPFVWQAGNTWVGIQKQATNISDSTLQLSQSAEMGWWEGEAGKAYTAGVADQYDAASAIASTAGTVSSACDSFFTATFVCAVTILAGLVAFLGALAAAPVDGGIGSLVVAVIAVILALGGAISEVIFGIGQPTRQLLGALPIQYMPGGSWPSATQGS
jgi:hypothetical protein